MDGEMTDSLLNQNSVIKLSREVQPSLRDSPLFGRIPALKRRAILERPCGTFAKPGILECVFWTSQRWVILERACGSFAK